MPLLMRTERRIKTMLEQLFKDLEIAYNNGEMEKADNIYKEICKIQRKDIKKMKKEIPDF